MNIFKTRKFVTNLLYIVITIVVPIAASFFIFPILMLMGFDIYGSIFEFTSLALTVGANILFILIVGYFLRDVLIENWKRLKFSKHFFITVFGTTFLMLGLSILTSIIASYFTGSGTPVNQDLIIESMIMFPILNLIAVSITAPLAEEFVFRFAMIRFTSKYKYIWLIASSLIFGLLHIHGDLIYLIYYSLFGLILGLIYLKTENIWYPIAIHFLNNFISSIEILVLYLI